MNFYQIANRQPQSGTDAPQVGRRTLDIVVACAALIVLVLPMALIALAILLESGRPILFSQVRIGKHGWPFRMFKFRKFHKDCGTDGLPLTLKGDARMTVVGRALRATKLDELPQFWNVLRGDMSIVGPRPETAAFADCFVGSIEQILAHKPGILGPSQIIFRNEDALFPPGSDPCAFYRAFLFPAKARIDLEYYQRRTLVRDIGWMASGALAILGFGQAAVAGSPRFHGPPESLSVITRDASLEAFGGSQIPQGRNQV
jgi:lipopolysaccharide/colanic/teichoic acid biosynthesis glycosyltransferase